MSNPAFSDVCKVCYENIHRIVSSVFMIQNYTYPFSFMKAGPDISET
jgi:hypothetical protein